MADCLWIAGLLWDLLALLLISIMVSLSRYYWIVYLRRVVADHLWIAGLVWDLLAGLLISITVSLIHPLKDCIPEVYFCRLSLDSRTSVGIAGSVADSHNG